MTTRVGRKPKITDTDFVRLFNEMGPRAMARHLNMTIRGVFARRRRLEDHTGSPIVSRPHSNNTRVHIEHEGRIHIHIDNGTVLIGSDAHIWPGSMSTGMRAFIQFCNEYKPAAVVMNGDVMDFPQISRHPPIGHQKLPDVQEEIETAQEQLHQIELAVNRRCGLFWTLGNHDARFETRLATIAPEFARLHGHSLKNHFPAWSPSWSLWINDDVVVKHRWKGGIHATHNNALGAGKTMVTGHLHSAKVTPYTDYNGTRWGVDTGTLANPWDKQFLDYTEDNPKNWIQAFGLLTFKDGVLLPPELVQVWDKNTVAFRGELIKVTP